MSILTVNLAENSYDIVIERGALATLGQRCRAVGLKGLAAVVTNPTVSALYGTLVRSSLQAAGFTVVQIEIPDGEEFKNSSTLNRLYDDLLEAGVDRGSFIVALGGGVVGDVAGYAAATWLRGIPFVQVPTTLLAQVDSSVGGKTGIDHARGKNLIGAFYQPALVLIDVDTLGTLDQRQFRAGLAEVIKYGVVIDLPFFEFVETNCASILAMEPDVLIEIILRSCQLKAQVVELDEKEAGLRAILNYGHTLGHAFESLSGYRDLVHGEAVAIGMVLAATVSVARGLCSWEERERIAALISRCGLPVEVPPYERQKLLNVLAADKKSKNGTITFICNQSIGMYVMSHHPPEELLTLSGLDSLVRAAGKAESLPDEDEEILDDLEILEELEIMEDDQPEPDALSPPASPEPYHSPSLPDPLSTSTVAELYVSQGFIHKALEIYGAILAGNPDDRLIAERINELKIREAGSLLADEALDDSGDMDDESELTPIPQPEALFGEAAPASGPAAEGGGDVVMLEGWLENIQRLKSCR